MRLKPTPRARPYSTASAASATVMSCTCQTSGGPSSIDMCSLCTRVPAAASVERHCPRDGGEKKDPPTGRLGFDHPAHPASNAPVGLAMRNNVMTANQEFSAA